MVRIIPRKTKVKFELFRGVTGIDLALGAIFVAIAAILLQQISNFIFGLVLHGLSLQFPCFLNLQMRQDFTQP